MKKNTKKTVTNVILDYYMLNVIDDRDGNYVLSRPVLFPTLSGAIDYAKETFLRFIRSNWGKDFKPWYSIKDTPSRLEKELAETGQFVMADDSGNFRRVFQMENIEVPLEIGQGI